MNASPDDDRHEDCNMKDNPDGLKPCFKPDENGVERVADVECRLFVMAPKMRPMQSVGLTIGKSEKSKVR